MIIIGLLGVIFATLFDINNISVAGSLGFLIVFALVNLANFKLYKQTGGNRLISGFGILLCFGAAIVLISYNVIHTPNSLMISGIIILGIGLFSIIYNKFRKKTDYIASFVDKRLENDEVGYKIKNEIRKI